MKDLIHFAEKVWNVVAIATIIGIAVAAIWYWGTAMHNQVGRCPTPHKKGLR